VNEVVSRFESAYKRAIEAERLAVGIEKGSCSRIVLTERSEREVRDETGRYGIAAT
jgi:hypothetical protein